jgi:hypothetical protein
MAFSNRELLTAAIPIAAFGSLIGAIELKANWIVSAAIVLVAFAPVALYFLLERIDKRAAQRSKTETVSDN